MAMDLVFVVCTRYKIIAIFDQFLFPYGRKNCSAHKNYRIEDPCPQERAQVVPFLSARCPGKRPETALRAGQKWEFPLLENSDISKKFLSNCSSDTTQNGLSDFSNPIHGCMTLRNSEAPKISGLPGWQPNPRAGLDLLLTFGVNSSSAASVL